LTAVPRLSRCPGRLPWLLWLAASLSIAAAPAAAAGTQACLVAELAAQPEFSGVALLHRQGQTHVAAQGVADATGRPLDAEARFNLGSVSKMFTAVAVAQLVAQGRLAFDAPIGRWVDGLSPEVAAVTLRQLLTHSGGLGNFFTPDNLAAMMAAERLADLLPLARDAGPRFAPGSQFQYSNNGFLLLGLAVERASGQPFDAYLQAHVFAPAGMAAASLRASLPRAATPGFTRLPALAPGEAPGEAPPMRPGTTGAMPPPPPLGPLRVADESLLPGTSAGGAYGTASDLLRFFDALRSGRLVGAAMLRELTRPQMETTPGQHHGLGFGLIRWEGHEGFGHNGGAPGVNAEAMVLPAADLVLVVLANRDPPAAARLMQALRRAVLAGTLCRTAPPRPA
jgi:D-alanyl-D-alanine carboxypeptidase